MLFLVACAALLRGTVASAGQRHPGANEWTNDEGGPLVLGSVDPLGVLLHGAPTTPSSPKARRLTPVHTGHGDHAEFTYSRISGLLSTGQELGSVEVASVQEALDACSSQIQCKGVSYASSDPNGTISANTMVYLKSTTATDHRSGAPWVSWLKAAPPVPVAAAAFEFEGLNVGLREDTFTVQWLNLTGANQSFVPGLSTSSALPLVQHLGDVTLRLRPAGADAQAWAFYASAWGALSVSAPAAPLPSGAVAAHDITPLLEATKVEDTPHPWGDRSPLRVVRSYRRGNASTDVATDETGFELAFEVTNTASVPVEIGAFGMSAPAGVEQDVHIGAQHGFLEYVYMHIAPQPPFALTSQCVVATPLTPDSALENWRPVWEFHGGGWEWTVHSLAWAEEWERNVQWPYLRMNAALNATGLWPQPRSPWPSWGDGGHTVRTNVTRSTHWNPPTSRVLAPGESVTYGMRFSACRGGPRTRDAALNAVGEPVLRAVPGYTLATDMATAHLVVAPPSGATVVGAESSDDGLLKVGQPRPVGAAGSVSVPVRGTSRGRARVSVKFSDGSVAVAHYLVLPPFPTQVANLAEHWSEVAWLPRDYPDPFGRGASVMPWDREDGRHRLNDGRAYDVGLSDDAGAASNLGLATTQAFAPTQSAVARLDEYVAYTLYGTKPETASAPLKSLQLPEPNNGVRMTLFYYNQSYFPWNYTEIAQCGVVAGLNYNWCMTEAQANATYRGFNYPHQIAVYYSLYRVARNHPRLHTERPWAWYLARAANTTKRLGYAKIGYMDGTICREVLRSLHEEHSAGGADAEFWGTMASEIEAGEKGRADYFVSAATPYGSEFAYDTTGQEEVVVWLLYFGHDDAANRTVEHVLSYMRHLPNWAYMGGAVAGDVANGGKWLVSAGTGSGDVGKMHYRAGLNSIALMEWYRRHPDDRFVLEIAVGAQSGQLGNIDESGAPAIYYHAYPHIMAHDAYSGDYGLGFFGSSLEAQATLVLDKELGPLCYLCDLVAEGEIDADGPILLEPRDAYRQRLYLEPLGLFLQADAGTFEAVALDLNERTIAITFAPPDGTYDVARLRVDKVSVPDAKRPGSNFVLRSPTAAKSLRGAYEIPKDVQNVTIGFDA